MLNAAPASSIACAVQPASPPPPAVSIVKETVLEAVLPLSVVIVTAHA